MQIIAATVPNEYKCEFHQSPTGTLRMDLATLAKAAADMLGNHPEGVGSSEMERARWRSAVKRGLRRLASLAPYWDTFHCRLSLAAEWQSKRKCYEVLCGEHHWFSDDGTTWCDPNTADELPERRLWCACVIRFVGGPCDKEQLVPKK